MNPRKHLNPPDSCDLCQRPIEAKNALDPDLVGTTEFYDAKTKMGPWGNLCPTCFKTHGISLGTGLGQHYVYSPDEEAFVKTEG